MTTLAFADRLLQGYGIAEPEDIDLEAIAFDQGATVVYRRLDGCEARIVGRGNRAIVSIDPRAIPVRKRFSLGHELAHWLLDRGTMSFLCKKTDIGLAGTSVSSSREKSANDLAAEILMPDYLFRPLCKLKPPTFETVQALASRFKTSLTTTAIRLVDIGYYPAMVTCFSGERREWFHRGRDVPDAIWPVRNLDEDSQAYELLRGALSNTKPTIQSAETWIDHPRAGDYEVIEHSIKVTDDAVVSLLWWKDEAQIRDLEGSRRKRDSD